MSIIGEMIKKQRNAKNLTQKQLAEAVGCAEITIRQYESGKREPRLDVLNNIATALQIELIDLLEMGEANRTFMENMLSINASHTVVREKNGKKIFDLDNEGYLLGHFHSLNRLGQEEAVKRVQELTEIAKYTKPDNHK